MTTYDELIKCAGYGIKTSKVSIREFNNEICDSLVRIYYLKNTKNQLSNRIENLKVLLFNCRELIKDSDIDRYDVYEAIHADDLSDAKDLANSILYLNSVENLEIIPKNILNDLKYIDSLIKNEILDYIFGIKSESEFTESLIKKFS